MLIFKYDMHMIALSCSRYVVSDSLPSARSFCCRVNSYHGSVLESSSSPLQTTTDSFGSNSSPARILQETSTLRVKIVIIVVAWSFLTSSILHNLKYNLSVVCYELIKTLTNWDAHLLGWLLLKNNQNSSHLSEKIADFEKKEHITSLYIVVSAVKNKLGIYVCG